MVRVRFPLPAIKKNSRSFDLFIKPKKEEFCFPEASKFLEIFLKTKLIKGICYHKNFLFLGILKKYMKFNYYKKTETI